MITLIGQTSGGEDVHAIDIAAGDLCARILTYGAILNEVRLAGVDRNLTVAPAEFAGYETEAIYHGALIGPVANRLSGAAAPIGGVRHSLGTPADTAPLLHSGTVGTGRKVWHLSPDAPPTDDSVTLHLALPDGEGGFPGNRKVTARFQIAPPGTLRLTIHATTDAPTLFNFANHSYWNLDGTPTWEGHRLQIAADHYLPTTPEALPTGEIAKVDGTAYDFRTPTTPAITAPPLDTNFCLSDAPCPIRDVLWLTGQSGVHMTMATTRTGLQVYDGREPRLTGQRTYQALAIEAQDWPDAPNNPSFPQIEYAADRPYTQLTEWRFART